LNDTYWKRQWPKGDNLTPETFDVNLFWKHGSPLFFGNAWSADVTAGCDNPTSSLPCQFDVQMTMADDEGSSGHFILLEFFSCP
jgi:hypothetical protein